MQFSSVVLRLGGQHAFGCLFLWLLTNSSLKLTMWRHYMSLYP
jgi:hypothetical protein